jgi:hypothetical protein
VIGGYSLCQANLSLAAGMRKNLSQVASGMILQNYWRLPVSIFSVKIAALRSLKRVTGMIFKISMQFKRASKNFEFDLFIN